MLLFAIPLALLGLIVGSFLNVVVLRKGVSPITGRSVCTSCGAQIHAYDLIPVFSWIMLRGRCRNCGSRISVQYPLVEATTALSFALVGVASTTLDPTLATLFILALHLLIVAILIAIAVYDMRHTIIPDEWAYGFAFLAFVSGYMSLHGNIYLFLLSGPIAALPLFVLWAVSSGRWMGLGDPKLALGIGWLLGFPNGLIAVFFSFILGSLILVPLMLIERAITHMRTYQKVPRGLTMKSEVPFGPFLIASTFCIWLLALYSIPFVYMLFGV